MAPLYPMLIGMLMLIFAVPLQSDLGVTLFYLGPVCVALGVAWLHAPISPWRNDVLVATFIAIGGTMSIGLAALRERSFHFDGDLDLVLFGVVLQIAIGAVAHGLCAALQRSRRQPQ